MASSIKAFPSRGHEHVMLLHGRLYMLICLTCLMLFLVRTLLWKRA